MVSFDSGANRWPLTVNSNLGLVEAGHWAKLRLTGIQQLGIGPTVRFGRQVGRGGQAGFANLTDSRCQLRVSIGSRTGASSPF